MIVDEPLETQLEIAFSLLIKEGFICEPKPQEEAPKIPSLDAIKDVVESLEDCSTNEIVEIVYALATGEKSIDDFNKWTLRLSLYIDGDKVDFDSTEFSLAEIKNGKEARFGHYFTIDYPTRDIEESVLEFVSDSIGSWGGEDEEDFCESWNHTCNFGCEHEIEATLEIERA
jgi:hypothetical protein